jgi:hypothetical protein
MGSDDSLLERARVERQWRHPPGRRRRTRSCLADTANWPPGVSYIAVATIGDRQFLPLQSAQRQLPGRDAGVQSNFGSIQFYDIAANTRY